ncbi:MAG: hypothetical protein N2376_02160, partial [Clostridia bacterium]|nr:hypothetical protein [Clostridia bacterium]
DTVYLLPFHTREFGCNYIPKKLDVSDSLVDPGIQEHLGLCGFEQMELFIQTARACGHPVIYDVLPQTGRFNLDVLKNPFIVRWFDINALDALMNVETSLDDAERYA